MTTEQIASGAKTVAHLATYFEELKQAALGFNQQFQASQRGYFTPSEDDRTRQLLISYWQSRCALLELVTAFRDDARMSAELRPAAFLVAFSGALLLVDAARFLRETFGESPVVREKLNEPEPHFGIPRGTYDTVQRSLTSPHTAWHLYHALEYFSRHETVLRQLSHEKWLAPALEVIDRLSHRLRVTAEQLARARLRVRAREAATALRRDLLGRALFGLSKLGGCLVAELSTRPGHSPSLPQDVRKQLAALVRPGDVFITRKEHAVTNYFLPGYWPHAALYLGNALALSELGLAEHEHVRPRWARLLSSERPPAPRVLEAMKDGVLIRPLDSPFGVDAIVVLRPRLQLPEVAQALARGLFHEGKPYDFDFDFARSDRLVCTEVVYRSYEGIGGLRFTLVRRAGRLTLAAEDLLEMALAGDGFDPLAIYSAPHAPQLCTGPAAGDILRKTRVHRRDPL
jgi:hypothetical protein